MAYNHKDKFAMADNANKRLLTSRADIMLRTIREEMLNEALRDYNVTFQDAKDRGKVLRLNLNDTEMWGYIQKAQKVIPVVIPAIPKTAGS